MTESFYQQRKSIKNHYDKIADNYDELLDNSSQIIEFYSKKNSQIFRPKIYRYFWRSWLWNWNLYKKKYEI